MHPKCRLATLRSAPEAWLGAAVFLAVSVAALMTPAASGAQGRPAPPPFNDHQNMLDQLGIRALRRGPNPNDQSTFDEAKANPYHDSMPEALRLKDGKRVRFLNVNDRLADANGRLREGMMNPDQLHPAVQGYQVWADGLKPLLTELLGPPATDHAPAPTGDPSARPASTP